MKDGHGRIKSLANILDNIISNALKDCNDQFILRGEAYEEYEFVKDRFC